jgi:hypothetical protein
MQKMVIFIKANTYNTSNLSKLGPRVVAHIILSHPNGCGVPHLGLGVMSHKCLFAGPWGLIVSVRVVVGRLYESQEPWGCTLTLL